jgi:hypothetical protein
LNRGDGVKRSVAMLAGLVLATVLATAPAAEALGAGVCTIGGTITFSPAGQTSETGAWSIAPATIVCRGQYNTKELMLRNGAFNGSGSYTSLPSAQGGCLHQLGTGSVDYWITTEKQDIHVQEPHAFLLAGAGAFTTPTLRGVFQIVSYEGDCLTGPVTTASFQAQVTLLRESLADWTI